MAYPLLPLFLVTILGSSKTQLGAVEGAAVLIVALMSAWAGYRSDRVGTHGGRSRVPWIRWGYGLPVIGKAMIAAATTWPMFFSGRLLDRFGKGLRGAPRDALIADAVSADHRGRAFGLHRAFDTAGALLGVLGSALLLGWLTGTPLSVPSESMHTIVTTPAWIYRVIFCVAAGLGLASAILTLLVRESDSREEQPTAKDTCKKPVSAAVNSTPSATWLELPANYWRTMATLVLFSLANSSDAFLLLRASDLGYSPWEVVIVYALYNSSYAAFSYPAGVLSDKLGRWRIIAVGWSIYIGVYAGVSVLAETQAWAMWPMMIAYGLYMALTDGVGKALIADYAPRNRYGAAIGLFYAITGLTTLGASLLAGAVWDHSGPTAAFLLSASFAVLALLTLPFVNHRESGNSH